MISKNLPKTSKIPPIKVVLISAISALLSSHSIAREQPIVEDGFVPLFNGRNWDGWHLKIKSGDAEMAAKVYAIEDGMVHVFKDLPDGLELNAGTNSTHGLFYTNKKYSRFIFRFDYKWGKKTYNNFNQFQYDAGCYYHVADDKIWPVGIEYQIRYDHLKQKNHTGDFWAYGIQWYAGPDGAFLLPRDGGTAQPPRKGEHPVLASAKHHALDDQWNQCEVIVMADEYAIHKLNGQVVNMATKLPHREGIIGLQSETAEIYYRNLRIKEFSESLTMEQFIK